MFPLKYIIDSNNNFVLFNRQSETSHVDMKPFFEGKIVGAGFCRVHGGGRIVCQGRSETLNIDSRTEDGEILTEYFAKEKVCNSFVGNYYPFKTVFATNIKGFFDNSSFEFIENDMDTNLLRII